MTGRPAVCLAVSGPGVVHALAGLGNAWANCWPMVLIGGATSTDHSEMGGFQVGLLAFGLASIGHRHFC